MSVPYVQRIVDIGDGGSLPGGATQPYSDDLHNMLFHPIAGDSMPKTDHKLPPLLGMKQLQFGTCCVLHDHNMVLIA
jgi:hypothetical protein